MTSPIYLLSLLVNDKLLLHVNDECKHTDTRVFIIITHTWRAGTHKRRVTFMCELWWRGPLHLCVSPFSSWLTHKCHLRVSHDLSLTCEPWVTSRTCTHMHESWHTINKAWHKYAWVLSHTWMSHVTHMHPSCPTHPWVMSHTFMGHVTHIHESCRTHAWVTAHICLRHGTHTNVSCHTYECVQLIAGVCDKTLSYTSIIIRAYTWRDSRMCVA